jgi:hypothetical protein
MTRTLGLCVVILLALSVGSSGGSPAPQGEATTTGNWLLVSCQLSLKTVEDHTFNENEFESFRDGYCRGIVEGVSSASPKVCPADNATYGQEVRVVVKYLQDHPEELHLRNTTLVEKALAKAFPCK